MTKGVSKPDTDIMVPQGTLLGPKLFNTISQYFKYFNSNKYAEIATDIGPKL